MSPIHGLVKPGGVGIRQSKLSWPEIKSFAIPSPLYVSGGTDDDPNEKPVALANTEHTTTQRLTTPDRQATTPATSSLSQGRSLCATTVLGTARAGDAFPGSRAHPCQQLDNSFLIVCTKRNPPHIRTLLSPPYFHHHPINLHTSLIFQLLPSLMANQRHRHSPPPAATVKFTCSCHERMGSLGIGE